jgi:hypothetical protein
MEDPVALRDMILYALLLLLLSSSLFLTTVDGYITPKSIGTLLVMRLEFLTPPVCSGYQVGIIYIAFSEPLTLFFTHCCITYLMIVDYLLVR